MANLRFSKVWRAHQGEPQDAFANCFNSLASAKYIYRERDTHKSAGVVVPDSLGIAKGLK